MKTKRHIFVSINMVLMGLLSPHTAAAFQSSVIIGSEDRRYEIGSSYDDVSRRFLPPCIDAQDWSWREGLGSSHLDLLINSQFANLRENVDRHSHGGFNVGFLAASKSIEYFRKIAESGLRDSAVIQFETTLGSVVMKNGAELSARGKSAINETSLSERRSRCGTGFVQQLDLGFRVKIAVTAEFRSHNAYEQYKTTSTKKALFGLFKKKRTEVQELERIADDVNFTVSMMQEGGNSSKGLALLEKPITCGLDTLPTCDEAITSALAYVSDASVEGGLVAQMAAAEAAPAESDAAVLRYIVAPYENTEHEGLFLSNYVFETSRAVGALIAQMEKAAEKLQEMSDNLSIGMSDSRLIAELEELRSQVRRVSKSCESEWEAQSCIRDGLNILKQVDALLQHH